MDVCEMATAMLTSLNYNRDTDYSIEVAYEILKRIKGYEHTDLELYAGHNTDEVRDDADIIFGSLVCAFGDYGTSPRYGWLDDETQYPKLIATIKDKINNWTISLKMEESEDKNV